MKDTELAETMFVMLCLLNDLNEVAIASLACGSEMREHFLAFRADLKERKASWGHIIEEGKP